MGQERRECPGIPLERDEFRLGRQRQPITSPSPRSSRGRDERSSLLEGWGEGLYRRARLVESPPHPDCIACNPTSPRKRGEVTELRKRGEVPELAQVLSQLKAIGALNPASPPP